APRRDAEVDPPCERAAPADRRRRVHGDALARRRRGAAPAADRDLLPVGRGGRRPPDPAVPSRVGLPRLRARRAGRALRALLPVGLLPDDCARVRDRGQVVPGVARRAVPPGLAGGAQGLLASKRGGNRRFPHEPPSLRNDATSREMATPGKARLRRSKPGFVTPLQGYSLPRTPLGLSSLVPAPPWHYAGEFLVLEYWADPGAVAAVLPPRLEPYAEDPGRCAALFVDWQWCTDGGGELDDPVRGQYREFFVVVNAVLGDEAVTTCPYIWVDKDVALVRGWVQGFPKKLGRIELTRSFPLVSPASPPDGPGGRFAATLTANERRLAWGAVTLERASEAGPTHNDPPIVNVRHFPRLEAGRHD